MLCPSIFFCFVFVYVLLGANIRINSTYKNSIPQGAGVGLTDDELSYLLGVPIIPPPSLTPTTPPPDKSFKEECVTMREVMRRDE